MRSDHHKLLVDLPRRYSSLPNFHNRRNRHLNCYELLEPLPKTSSIRPRHKAWAEGKEQTDRIEPLFRFLASKCGDFWDNIYSEICSLYSKRSILGDHLFEHLRLLVSVEHYFNADGVACSIRGGDHGRPISSGFYLTREGILRRSFLRPSSSPSLSPYLRFIDSQLYVFNPIHLVWFHCELYFLSSSQWAWPPGFSRIPFWLSSLDSYVKRFHLCRLRVLKLKEKRALALV